MRVVIYCRTSPLKLGHFQIMTFHVSGQKIVIWSGRKCIRNGSKKFLYNFVWHMEGKRSIGMAKNREKTWKVIFWKCPDFNGPVLHYMTTRTLGYWFIWKFRSIPIGIHWEIPNPYVGSHFMASQSWVFWPIFWSFDPLSGPGLGVGGPTLAHF